MKKSIASILLVLGVAGGSLVAAGPAQAYSDYTQGAYSTLAQCKTAQASRQASGYTIIRPCFKTAWYGAYNFTYRVKGYM